MVTSILLLWTLLTSKACLGLRLVRLDVPAAVPKGDAVWMHCNYDLDGDDLYSVKWYKNHVEFYRFLPSDKPPGQTYGLPGIYVDLNMSNESHIYLYKTDLNSEGTYMCEVSTESPSFSTIKAEREMKVYVLPTDDLYIEGVLPRYDIGDEVNLTCSLGPSRPLANITWYINDERVPPEYEISHPPVQHRNRLQSTSVGLLFVAQPSHFWQGIMRLRCGAIVRQMYSVSSVELIIGDKPSHADHHHGLLSPSGSEAPTITGNQKKYEVGDMVDVNCTSASPMPAAFLKWFINDKEVQQIQLIPYPRFHYPNGEEELVLGLRFRMQQKYFHSDEMRLKCTAVFFRKIKEFYKDIIIGSYEESSELHAAADSRSGSSTPITWSRSSTCWWSSVIFNMALIIRQFTTVSCL